MTQQPSDFLERISDAFVALDPEWVYRYVNQRAAELFGRTPETLIGRHIWTEFPDGVGQPFQLAYERAMREQVPVVMEAYYEPWQRWFENRIYPSADGVSIFFTEITDRVRLREQLTESERRYRSLVEASEEGIGLHSEGVLQYANRAMLRLLGARSAGQVLGSPIQRFLHPSQHGPVIARIERVLAGQPVSRELERWVRLDGTELWVEASCSLVALERGPAVQTVARDVTAAVGVRQVLEHSERRYRTVFEQSRDPIFVADAAGVLIDLNPAAEEVFRAPRESILGRRATDFVSGRAQLARLLRGLRGEGGLRDCQLHMRRPDGSRFEGLLTAVTYPGEGAGYQGTIRDVTEARRMEERLRRLAFYDQLTDLASRTLLIDRLRHAIQRMSRADQGPFGLIYLDLDRFKDINDSLGHAAGDALLVEVARRIAACIRPGDTAARLGGDEFGILLEGQVDEADALAVATRIQAKLAAPFLIAGAELQVSASMGVVCAARGVYGAPDQALRDADLAMYAAKARGRGHHEVFRPDMHTRAMSRLETESDLRRALAGGDLRVFYQPIVDASTLEVAGFEALVRWQHPERGLLPPAAFLAIAEDSGIIADIDVWVLGEACRQLAEWRRAEGGGDLFMCVNLSGRQLQRDAVAERVAATLRAHALPARALSLEITESMLVDSRGATSLQDLSALGVRLHLDDFGTGYSSLSYLYRFDVHGLKIDRSFVASLMRSRESQIIVRAILALSSSLGMETVAEGVETVEQSDRLRAEGCRYLQGYLFGRPAPPGEVGPGIPAALPAAARSGA
jgi:diguanylate cyclase (GGDEF)-like protein/PAS domain S-box-containing protein